MWRKSATEHDPPGAAVVHNPAPDLAGLPHAIICLVVLEADIKGGG